MKRYTIILALLFATCSAAFAQDVKISGQILNRITQEVKFTYYTAGADLVQKVVKAPLSSNGQFSVTLPMDGSYNIIIMEHGDELTELMAKPGASLRLRAVAKEIKTTIKYTGKGSEAANFAAWHLQQVGQPYYYSAALGAYMNKPTDSMLIKAKRIETIETDYLEQYNKSLPADFKTYWQQYFAYQYYNNLLKYPAFRNYYRQQNKAVTPADTTIYKVLKYVPVVFDDKDVDVYGYGDYITQIFPVTLTAAGYTDLRTSKGDLFRSQGDSVAKLAAQNMPPKTLEFYKALLIRQAAEYKNIAYAQKQLEEFTAAYPKSEYTKALKTKIERKLSMAAGHAAPDFSFPGRKENETI